MSLDITIREGGHGQSNAFVWCHECRVHRQEWRVKSPTEPKEDEHAAFVRIFATQDQAGGWPGWSMVRCRFLTVMRYGKQRTVYWYCAYGEERIAWNRKWFPGY